MPESVRIEKQKIKMAEWRNGEMDGTISPFHVFTTSRKKGRIVWGMKISTE
jgi:hypothetical protein